MIRNMLLTVGGALVVTGIVGMLSGHFTPSLVALVWGGIVVFGILYERAAYKTIVDKVPTGKHWVQTSERFLDDKTGKTVVVYYNTLTGERAYVAVPSD